MAFLNKRTFRRKVLLLLLYITGISTAWNLSMSFGFYLQNIECGCGKRLEQDHPWFMQRFQKNITPLLTSNYTLSQEAFNWWKKVQGEKRDIMFFKQTTQKIFELFPAFPPVPEPGLDGCRTCAVVGNSGTLKRSHYGKLIDHHTSVIRINYGKTKGFEQDVGRRTTHRVMYPESSSGLDNSTHLVLFPFRIKDLEWLVGAFTTDIDMKSSKSNKKMSAANKNLVMVLNPAFMKYVHQSWLQGKGDYPSTGFMTVILALHICDEVSVFGFGADSDGNWSHYWEVLRNKTLKTGGHPGSVEYDMIVELAKRGKLDFYRGW
uniref:CMP-N-acetylneuraminate-beta-galactosamide-alpha-2,3-sialyltransferase 1 n=1 Tax=Neogobius melanostomus TaxID=47308 RepID=A0A8C6UN24_9GOBI